MKKLFSILLLFIIAGVVSFVKSMDSNLMNTSTPMFPHEILAHIISLVPANFKSSQDTAVFLRTMAQLRATNKQCKGFVDSTMSQWQATMDWESASQLYQIGKKSNKRDLMQFARDIQGKTSRMHNKTICCTV